MLNLFSPCSTCPYKLGTVKTFVNPCLQCKYGKLSQYRKINDNLSKGK